MLGSFRRTAERILRRIKELEEMQPNATTTEAATSIDVLSTEGPTSTNLFESETSMPCPNDKVNTRQHENGQTTNDVLTASACSDLCRAREGCTHWSWVNGNGGTFANRLELETKVVEDYVKFYNHGEDTY